MNRELIRLEAQKELARREFWEYCKLKASDFYKEDRLFLKDLSTKLQWFIEEAEEQIMVANIPPRHGKSRTGTNFVQWLFGKYGTKVKVMTGSYNETLSGTFAKQVRDCIAEKPTQGVLVYNDIFPNTKIKYGEAAASKWALEGSEQANYLATSPSGTSTGFGCNIMILDDLIKSASEAYNENTLAAIIDWFNNTMLSRTENGFKLIILMTRWASNDLAGYILDNYDNVVHVNYKAVQDDGSMLCSEILSKKDYELKTKNMNKDIVAANYQQEPIDVKGRLYTTIKTYTDIPKDENGNVLFEYILNYTDTADTGSDFLCSIDYGIFNNTIYILDVLYTDKPMEVTEPMQAKMMTEDNVGSALIESNNGGRGYARNVERECRALGNYHTNITWFHQSANKVARILSNSTSVMNNVLFPINWQDRFPEFAEAIRKYQKQGKNIHDDACFVEGTMVATLFGDKPIEKIRKGEYVITPYGLRKVLASGCTGEKETITKFGIEATPNHKFFTKKGFVSFDTLTGVDENGKICLKELMLWVLKKQLYLMVSNMNCLGRESIISVSQIQIKGVKGLKAFMLQYGNITTKRKCLKVVKFIIKTLIHLIMILAIWNVYQLSNMLKSMLNIIKKVRNGSEKIKNLLKKQEKKQKNGTQARKARLGILNMVKKSCKEEKLKNSNVLNVEKNLKVFNHGLNSVVINVAKSGEEKISHMNTKQFANIVEKSLLEKSLNLLQKEAEHVQEDVQTSLDTKREKKKVYNITVEGNHVYYAHGFLVSNCDALTGVYENQKPKGMKKLNRKIAGGI